MKREKVLVWILVLVLIVCNLSMPVMAEEGMTGGSEVVIGQVISREGNVEEMSEIKDKVNHIVGDNNIVQDVEMNKILQSVPENNDNYRLLSASSYEYAMFPMMCLNITQGEYGRYSHSGIRAIDNAGVDSGKDAFFAPFSGQVVRMQFGSASNNVIIESINPVQWADGTIDYAHIWMAHDEDISDLYEGKTFCQGEEIYREGQKGEATGNHVHFVCGKGKYNGLVQVSTGKWTVNNEVSAYNLLYLSNNTQIKNGNGYNWRSIETGETISLLTNTGVTNITDTTAKINATLPGVYNISEAGFYYGTSAENMTKVVEATSGSVQTAFYTLGDGKWCASLSPGTTYYYQIYVIINGVTHISALDSFTTTGIGDTTAPTINASYYSYIDKDRFTVVANVSDNIGVTRVLFPTWRNEDQVGEDAIWHEGIKQADGTWAVTIELSSYENKEGTYITHIYAYDAAGNHVSSGLSTYIDRTPPQISDVSITNVNGSGFTVNCNVTDNKEIDRVQFPVWTDANGQDDLIIDWNTNTVVSGTCYGNNFSFRVNDSDHNYERGVYHVHIYAYDKYGNYTPHTLTYDFQGADDPTEETPDNPSEESPDDPTEETPDNPSEESPDNPSEETPDDPLEETPDNPSAEYPEEPNEDTPTEDIPDNIPDEDIPAGLWIAGIEGTGYSYTGKPIKPEVRVYHHKTLLKEKKDYTISYKNNTKANNAMVNKTAPTITITGKGNYNSKETVTFKILPKSIEDENTVISDIYANSSNKVQTPIPVVTCDGKKLKNNTDFTVEYPDLYTSKYQPYKAPGDYAILIKGKGNYTGTRMVTLSITNKNLMNKVTVSKIKEQEYTGHDITPAVTVKQGSVMLLEGSDYTIAYENNREVGTASIILTGIGRYSGEKRVIFKIKGQDIKNAVVTGIPTEIEYTGSAITAASTAWRTKPVLTMTKKLIEGKDYTVSYQKNTDKGTASILFKGINGYSGTLKKTFKITPYNILDDTKNKLSVSIQTQVAYAKGGSKPKTTVKVGNTILTEGKDYTLSYKNNKAIKSRNDVSAPPTVIIKGKGNYSGSVSVNYTIMQQSLSKMTIGIQDKVYKNQKNAYKSIPKITDIDGKVLTPGTDYEKNILYTYKNKVVLLDGSVRDAGDRVQENDIVPAGTVIVVTARGTGNYSNNSILQGEYRIVNADISKANIKIIPQIYTGKEIKLNKDAITVKIGQFYLSDLDYEIVEGSYKNNIKKGTASVTIRGVGNYGGSKTVKFTIKPKGFLWWWR